MWKEVAMNDDIYIYTRKSLESLCVFSRVRRRQACLPPTDESIQNPIPTLTAKLKVFPKPKRF